MRSMKKIFALAMVVMMLFAFATIVSSAEEGNYTDAANRLASLNILKGDTSGNLMLDQGVTRYQAALFFVQAMTGETTVDKWNAQKQSTIFSDVPEYATAIDYAYGIDLIRGRGNGIYGYNDPITYQDMLVMAVRALGYETQTTVYPYGYIETAKKLELTENLAEGINYTDALTRGETVQIIWNMLGTYVAAEDPIGGGVIFPNDYSKIDSLLSQYNIKIKRETLLKQAGFVYGEINGTIVKYKEAATSDDVDTVTLDNGLVLAAEDLGITSRTRLETFLGLPVTLFVDCKVSEFEKKYDTIAEFSEAKIILADLFYEDMTNVVNVGKGGDIKVETKTVNGQAVTSINLGGTSFRTDKYDVFVGMLNYDPDVKDNAGNGWYTDPSYLTDFVNAFICDAKGKYVGTNSYGEVDYKVVYNDNAADTTNHDLYILYKPYEFGQYFTRSIFYGPTYSSESFITIGKYVADSIGNNNKSSGDDYKNFAGTVSYFHEYVLGSGIPAVTPDTSAGSPITSLSKEEGEKARDAKLSGESVRGGDFIFYYYNELDNVLEVGYNCGALVKGNVKSYNDSKESVKIESTNYDFGFEGAYTDPVSPLPGYSDYDFADDYIALTNADDKNASYLAVNDNVIFIQRNPINPGAVRTKHSYAIITDDPEVMSELVDKKYVAGDPTCAYNKALTDGLYIAESGNVCVAKLNTSKGEWELIEVSKYEYGTYVHVDDEWSEEVNVKTVVENYNVFGNSYKDKDKYSKVKNALTTQAMLAVRGNSGNVYELCALWSASDYGMINNVPDTTGLVFSDDSPVTHRILKSRSDTEKARITLKDSTIIVVIDKSGNVAVRKGIQDEASSITFTAGTGIYYGWDSKLIVLKFGNDVVATMTDPATGATVPFDAKVWGENSGSATETYYIATNSAGVEYERLEDDTYDVTVSGLFNLRTMRAVSAIKVNVKDIATTDFANGLIPGQVVHMQANGKLVVERSMSTEAALKAASDLRDTNDKAFSIVDISAVDFVDESSITVSEFNLSADKAIGSVNMTVAAINVTTLDMEDYDTGRIAYDMPGIGYDEDVAKLNGWDTSYIKLNKTDRAFAYALSGLDTSSTIKTPTVGVLNQYIIDTAATGEKLLLANVEDKFIVGTEADGTPSAPAAVKVDLYACGRFDEKTGELTLYVVKLLKDF